MLVSAEYVGIAAAEHLAVDTRHGFGDFGAARPDILQVHRLILVVVAQRLAVHVDARGAGRGEGDHQRWRGQPVGLDQRVHAALEVAVAGQHRRYDQVVVGNRLPMASGNGPELPIQVVQP